jgi:hypothetical protein
MARPKRKGRPIPPSAVMGDLSRLAPEIRVRIYQHYFQSAIVRFTRSSGSSRDVRRGIAHKPRVYFKSSIALMVVCKAVYLEAHPIYASSLTLILRNCTLQDLPPPNRYSPLKFIQRLEIASGWYLRIDLSLLPALKQIVFPSEPADLLTRHLWPCGDTLTQEMQYWNGFHDSRVLETYISWYKRRTTSQGTILLQSKLPTWLDNVVYDASSAIQVINTVKFCPSSTSRVKNIFLVRTSLPCSSMPC